MGVMLTFKSKSYCSSCLRGAVMGVSPGSASPCTVVLQGVASMGRDRDRDGGCCWRQVGVTGILLQLKSLWEPALQTERNYTFKGIKKTPNPQWSRLVQSTPTLSAGTERES